MGVKSLHEKKITGTSLQSVILQLKDLDLGIVLLCLNADITSTQTEYFLVRTDSHCSFF